MVVVAVPWLWVVVWGKLLFRYLMSVLLKVMGLACVVVTMGGRGLTVATGRGNMVVVVTMGERGLTVATGRGNIVVV